VRTKSIAYLVTFLFLEIVLLHHTMSATISYARKWLSTTEEVVPPVRF